MNRRSWRLAALLALLTWSRWVYSQTQIQVGYAVVTADVAGRLPVGTALFSYTNGDGVLVSEAAVGASQPIKSGRTFVNEAETKTGVALANPSAQTATITLILRDPTGKEISRKTLTLPAQQQTARYVNELFTDRPANFTGSLTFESDQPVAAITLRESRNVYDEPLYSTLPVLDVLSPPTTAPVFPHIAAGLGYTTQLILINPTSNVTRGQVRLFDDNGLPLTVLAAGNAASQFSYQIEANGTFTASLDSTSGLKVGYAQVVPDAGNAAPGGTAIYQFRQNGKFVTEASVSATATIRSRAFIDQIQTRTGIAISNSSTQTATVTLTLLDRFATVERSVLRTVPPLGHLSAFADELFPDVAQEGFTGLLEIQSNVPVAPIALKITVNKRGEQVLTTLPVADLTQASTAQSSVFAHLVIGAPFATRLLFVNSDLGNASTGQLTFFNSDSTRMNIPLEGSTGSQFGFRVGGGSGRQFLPGNTSPISSLFLVPAGSNQPTNEVAVNVGNAVRPRIRAIDNTGRVRDDFDATYASLDGTIAAIDSVGLIQGKAPGFSTLTVSARGVVTNATVTVVTVDSGGTGFDVTGITQDLARRVYLAATTDQTIRVADNLQQAATVYAGISKQQGLRNDVRLQSQFFNPTFLAISQADGSLYVSDSANQVIRRVTPGRTGAVETLAGTGGTGSNDGALIAATFNNPQGVALDARGNLWIADSDNHSIRRINLTTRIVETIAGKSGSPGLVDGKGGNARFKSPIGIAVETESVAAQLDRERRRIPPPPVTVIVADTGNGVLRRVSETGDVTTLSAATSLVSQITATGKDATLTFGATSFGAPTGVAVDALGNIFVTDAVSGSVRTLLKSGGLVDAVQGNTFFTPRGVAINESSKVLIADANRPTQQIQFGEPKITSITPNRVGTRGGVTITIKGSNFAPDSALVIGGIFLSDIHPTNTQTFTFVAPALPSGRIDVTVQNRGGIAQSDLLVDAIPLETLAAGQITTVAGGTTFAGDGRSATSAVISSPYAITVDASGNIFIADSLNYRIRRVAARTGIITTVAGTGVLDYSGDGGPATAAGLLFPMGIAADAAGNLYFSNSSAIRKVDATTGIISTIAGGFVAGDFGDGGQAKSALLNYPHGLTVDAAGNLYIVDYGAHRVRKIVLATGIITTVAGNGTPGFSGDGGKATSAQLNQPIGIAADRAGNLYIADTYNFRIRKVDAVTGIITTVAGNGQLDNRGNGGPATSASLQYASGVVIDPNGNLVILDSFGEVRRVDAATGIITLMAGNGNIDFSGDGGLATAAAFAYPQGIAGDGAGNLFIADTFNNRIRRVSALTGVINTIVGGADRSGDNGSASVAALNLPSGIAFNSAGDLFISDSFNHRIRKVTTSTGIITAFAGDGFPGFFGDGGLAQNASLFFPLGIAFDRSGNLFIADSLSSRIRRVSTGGVITTVAGSNQEGFAGDGGPATSAALDQPRGIAVDANGNIFFSDSENNRIRRIDAGSRIITTVAGNGQAGYSGDNGPATAAKLNSPRDLVIDSAGNIFFADRDNYRVRKIAAGTGIITTVAGNGQIDFYSVDGGLAVNTPIFLPESVVLDTAGNLYISNGNRVQRVSASTGIIKTVAGTGDADFYGDGGAATAAALFGPARFAFSARGDLFIADFVNSRIRAIRAPIP